MDTPRKPQTGEALAASQEIIGDEVLGAEIPLADVSDAEMPKGWELDEHDLSLIRLMKTLSPSERLRRAQQFAQSVARLRRARRV